MRWVFLPVFGHENDGLFYPVREGVEKYMLEDIRREMEEYRKERMVWFCFNCVLLFLVLMSVLGA